MNEYTPDRWCLIEADKGLVKVFSMWGESYLCGASWRSNSGIEKVTQTEDYYLFHGFSGSVYNCRKNAYGLTPYGASVLSHADLEPMTEEEAIETIKKL